MSSFYFIRISSQRVKFLNCLSISFKITVHDVPAPPSTNADVTNNTNEGGNNQKLMLFNLGNLD